MTGGFRIPDGFEEALRSPVDVGRARLTPAILRPGRQGHRSLETRFTQLARRAPEVMVKVTGRTRDAAHLRAHLDYISRNGTLELGTQDGERLEGRAATGALAADWVAEMEMDAGRRKDCPLSRSIVLSMPAGTDPRRLEEAAVAFAREVFADRFPWVSVLHDEGRHPHIHLTVRTLGTGGERLNPRKADLQLWRELFAARLRERDIPAEATPRRARGIVMKAERTPVRRMRERFMAGRGPLPRVLGAARLEAGMAERERPWEGAIQARQSAIRRAYLALAIALARSDGQGDRELAADLDRFVREMPPDRTRAGAIRESVRRSPRAPPERDRG